MVPSTMERSPAISRAESTAIPESASVKVNGVRDEVAMI